MWSAIALALGLAMDSMAVSAALGLSPHRSRDPIVLPILFGGFQSGMAELGLLIGRWLGPYFVVWNHWVALGLLVLVGGKMIVDPPRPRIDRGTGSNHISMVVALGLALATSLDAAATGLVLPTLPVAPWIAVAIIGSITTACSAIGYLVGRIAGKHVGVAFTRIGGLVIVATGVQLLFE